MKILDFNKAFLEACVHLYIETFNAAPWNDHWDYETTLRRFIKHQVF